MYRRRRNDHRRKDDPFEPKDLQMLFDLQDDLPDFKYYHANTRWFHRNQWLIDHTEQMIQVLDIFGQERVADFLGMTEYLLRTWRSRHGPLQ